VFVAPSFTIRQSEVDRNAERKTRMAQVVEQFATRLTLRPIRCRVAESGVAPAWSTSNTISFNGQNIGDLLDPRVVTATRGLALHEVCHILFTPRTGSDIMQWVIESKLGRAFNALEDQRIETLMVGRFGSSVVDWFTYMVAEHLLDSPQAMAYSFPLIRGRKYLPAELRRAVRDLYVNQQDVAELEAIIDEYRLLLFPADTERAKELIARYNQLVKQAGQDEAGNGNGWDKTHDPHAKREASEHESTTKSKPLSDKEQKRAKANAEAREEQDETEAESATNTPDQPAEEPAEDEFNFGDGDSDWEDEDEDEPTDSDGGQPSDSDSDSSDSDADTETDSDTDAPADAQPADGDAPADAQPTDQPSESTSDTAGTSGDAQLTDLLENISDSVLERLADQLADDIRKFNGEAELEGERVGAPALAQHQTASVSPTAMRASKSFGVELERLRADFDPAWERRTSSGRINAQRYMTGADLDEVFDRWDEGRDDAVDIEAVILLDTSGSMGSQATSAYESMWALKRALDKVGAGCTVVTFSYGAKLLYGNTELASNTMRFAGTGGGTSPLQALKYSTRVLADSSRAVKVLFTITDGEWSDAEECDKLVKRLREGGVLTALAYIGGAWDGESASDKHHNSEVFSHIRSSADLFSLGRSLVKVATQRNLTK